MSNSTGTAAATVACGACGRRFRWDARFAGRKVLCKCGQVFVMPATAAVQPSVAAAQVTEASEIELNERGPNPADRPRALVASPAPAPQPVSDAKPETDTDARSADEPTTAAPSFLDVKLPALIAVAGVVMTFFIWKFYFFPGPLLRGLAAWAVVISIQALLFLPLAFAAVIMAARMLEMSFGGLIPVVVKLAAITFGPAAIADALFFGMLQIYFDWEFALVAMVLYMVFIGGPTLAIFRSDFYETGFLVLVQAVPRIGIFLGVASLAPQFFGTKAD